MMNSSMSLAQAAEELGVHYMTVYRYVRTGRLPAQQVAGEWHIDRADLDRWQRPAPGRVAGGPAKTGLPGPARLEARLVAGDEAGAWALVEAALAAGMAPDESLLELVVPAMRLVGVHWESGKCSIADEHRATAVATRLVARLGSRFAPRGVRRGTVVLAAPAGELHGLPVAIGANLLRWKGFNVAELGADTPAAALAEAVASEAATSTSAGGGGTRSPLTVGIASTVDGGSRSVRSAIAEVRRCCPDVPIMLGGAAITGAAQARRLGADIYTGKRADELVRAVEALVNQRH
jgi:excisionase family DNA binding protein